MQGIAKQALASKQDPTKELANFVSKIRNRFAQQVNQSAEAIRNTSSDDVKDANRRFYEFFLEHLSNYYKSVQSLLEGRREVLQDENFRFEDGETVKQKELAFEKKVQALIGKLRK